MRANLGRISENVAESAAGWSITHISMAKNNLFWAKWIKFAQIFANSPQFVHATARSYAHNIDRMSDINLIFVLGFDELRFANCSSVLQWLHLRFPLSFIEIAINASEHQLMPIEIVDWTFFSPFSSIKQFQQKNLWNFLIKVNLISHFRDSFRALSTHKSHLVDN